MDDATLIRILETALSDGTLNDRDTRRVRKLLPALPAGTIHPDDRLDLVEIATKHGRQQASSVSTIG